MIGWLIALLIAATCASIGIWAVAYNARREREPRGNMDRLFEAVVAERDDLRASLRAARQNCDDAVAECRALRERLEIAQREERAWQKRAERASLWTAVADALPDDPDEEVVVLDGGSGHPALGQYHREIGWTDCYGRCLSGVTHWARLPESDISGVSGGNEDGTSDA